MISRRSLGLATAAATILARPARAAWPDRPVRLIVPAAPGGPTDIAARVLAQYLTPLLGQSVVVDNRAGGAGNIGTQAAAQSAPDGYTLLMASFAQVANPAMFPSLPYDTERDLVALSQVTRVPVILTVPEALPARDIAGLIALARQGGLTWASGGVGTSSHLIGELFWRAAGVQVPVAHYRGAAPANQDLVAGRVQLLFDNPQTALPLLAGGRTRALAVTTAQRIPELPDVPTLSETIMPGFDVVAWHGVVGRAGTPDEVLDRLSRDIATATRSPEAAPRWKELGVQPVGSTRAAFSAFFKEEMERWGKVVRDGNIKPE